MDAQACITISVTVLVLVALIRELPADLTFLSAIIFLCLTGILTPAEAFDGFVNPSLLMLAALFIVTTGLRETGIIDSLGQRILGGVHTETVALLTLSGTTVVTSMFVNNTPIVAIMIPVVLGWCRRHDVAASRLLIPLSFVTILGGCCSRIGTSTNLVVAGLMKRTADPQLSELGFFELSYVGIPCVIVGVLYLLTVGRRLLPDREQPFQEFGRSRREYLAEMKVLAECPLAGKSVAAAQLRGLAGLFLIEITRGNEVISPVTPDDVLQEGDVLVFTGLLDTIIDLKKIRGLQHVGEPSSEDSEHRRLVCEAVISRSSPLIGRTPRQARFRSHYDAVIIAVHRNGRRINRKIGDIRLENGDTLLMQTGTSFVEAHRNNPDFYLVSDVRDARPVRRAAWKSAAVLFASLLMLMFFASAETAMLGAFAAGILMIATRCMSATEARESVDWPVLIAVGASFGLGEALKKTGVAEELARYLVSGTSFLGPIAALAAVYLVTMVLNELITNNAAAVLTFPIAVEAAMIADCNPRPFVIAVALASSLAFASPIGYQTHMMVYGPGGYRFSDFFRVGLPLNLLMWTTCMVLIPRIWTLQSPPQSSLASATEHVARETATVANADMDSVPSATMVLHTIRSTDPLAQR